MEASSHALSYMLCGALLCAPAAALAHGQAPGPVGAAGHSGSARPFTLRSGVSIPLGPHLRGAEPGARGGEGAPGSRLIEGISAPHSLETAPAPTPASDFDPLKRRRIALPLPAPPPAEI